MKTALVSIASLLTVFGAITYQLYGKQVILLANVGKELEYSGNTECFKYPELQACEKIVLLDQTLYAACSSIQSRAVWVPALNKLNYTARPSDKPDYVAILSTAHPSASSSSLHIKYAKLTNLPADWPGLSVHGMDIVASETEKGVAWVYLVNHRVPVDPQTGDPLPLEALYERGADSVVEVFKTRLGSDIFEYVTTVRDEFYVRTPNDLVGKSDGTGFWVSNDHSKRRGFMRTVEVMLQLKSFGVSYCDISDLKKPTCKLAISGLPAFNGITRSRKGEKLFYGGGYGYSGKVFVLEVQSDDSLVLRETIDTGGVIDNVSVGDDENIYVAILPKVFHFIGPHVDDGSSYFSPSRATRISINKGQSAYFGEKFKVDVIFTDDGNIASGITSVAFDTKTNRLWLSGLVSHSIASCKISSHD